MGLRVMLRGCLIVHGAWNDVLQVQVAWAFSLLVGGRACPSTGTIFVAIRASELPASASTMMPRQRQRLAAPRCHLAAPCLLVYAVVAATFTLHGCPSACSGRGASPAA